MKKTMKKAFLAAVCAMSMGLAACGGSTTTGSASASSQTEGTDYSLYPETFEEWGMANLKSYLRDTGIFEKNEWCFDMSSGDLEASGAAAGTMYVDTEAGTITDIILYYDATDDAAAAILEGARTDHAVTPGDPELGSIPMDAMIGNFVITYTMGSDADHNAALVQALKDLAEHYGVTPDYITE